MDCPRCGAVTIGTPDCPRCGVVLAKARPSAARPEPPALPAAERSPAWRALVLPGLGLVALAFAAFVSVGRNHRRDSASARPAVPPRFPIFVPSAQPQPSDPLAPARPPVPETVDTGALTAAAAADVRHLLGKLQARASIEADDVRSAERLYEQSPEAAARLLGAVLVQAASRHRAAHDYAQAAELLARAIAVAPDDLAARRGMLAIRVDQADWPAVETVAGEILRQAPGDGDSVCALARALVHQDRAREALDTLRAFLDDLERRRGSDRAGVADLYWRIRKDLQIEAPLRERTLAHFHVRYDGAAHEEVGRAILQVLERHYATLALTFARQPPAAIPVVLLSEQRYYGANGAPAWSGGQFDSFNGGVRIPIAGLTSSLTPELDQVLMHELTHAFVTNCSAGLAPGPLQEGLAQLMEGHHAASELGDDGLRALADRRIQGVSGEYLLALAFVEDLVAQHGQGGINDLLEAMSRTRNSDEAFRQVYGRGFQQLQDEWFARFRRRYGS